MEFSEMERIFISPESVKSIVHKIVLVCPSQTFYEKKHDSGFSWSYRGQWIFLKTSEVNFMKIWTLNFQIWSQNFGTRRRLSRLEIGRSYIGTASARCITLQPCQLTAGIHIKVKHLRRLSDINFRVIQPTQNKALHHLRKF